MGLRDASASKNGWYMIYLKPHRMKMKFFRPFSFLKYTIYTYTCLIALWTFSLKAKHYFKEGMRKLQYILSGSHECPENLLSFAWKSVFQFAFGKILPILNRNRLLKHFAKYSHFENDFCENVFQNAFFRSLAQVKEVFRCGSISFYILKLFHKE